jgi:RsiW-degrading membrane proteinase PrsW (M82 family)
MGRSLLIVSVMSGAVSVVRLLSSLFVIYLTLGWKVRRARKAFEKELIREGMPEEAVKRMGARYAAVKDDTLNALKARTLSFRSSSGRDNVDESVDESRLQIFGVKF